MDYYLPAGRWTNILSNQVVEGGKWLHEVHDFMSLPLMARENSILPVVGNDSDVEYDYGTDLTLHVFELNGTASCDVVNMKGEHILTVSAKNQDGRVSMSFEGRAEGLKVLLRNVEAVENLSGAAAQKTEQGLRLTVDGLGDVSWSL